MLANCHRLAMDRFDKRGKRHDGAHPQPWVADEFLPDEFKRGPARRAASVIQGSIECLKMFVAKGAEPQTLARASFTVVPEE